MKYSLKDNGDFTRLIHHGKKVRSKSLLLFYFKSGSKKIGFSVSKKHGGAVKRNFIKRRLRAAINVLIPNMCGDYYFLFIPTISENYSYRTFLSDMTYLLSKEGIIGRK